MAINELIAQGVRPIGADIPNVLAQIQQAKTQKLQNALMQQQMNANMAAQDRQSLEGEAKQTYAETQWALSDQVPSKRHAIQSLPHVVAALQKQGIDPSGLSEDQATTLLQDWQARAASKLGIAPPEQSIHKVGPGESLVGIRPGQAPNTLYSGAPKSDIGNVNPGDFTPDSIAKYKTSGNYNDLVPRERQPLANIRVNADKSFATTLAEQRAKSISDMYDQARKAPQIIQQAQLIRKVLEQGTYTGSGANFKLQFGKAARAAGLDYAGSDISNTEVLASQLGQATLDAIRASGLGSGQGFTNTDRQFLERVVGGNITFDQDTLKRLSVLHERAARATISNWKETSKGLDSGMLSRIGITPISEPSDLQADPTRPVKVSTPEEAMSLPSGTIFETPDGRIKTRP